MADYTQAGRLISLDSSPLGPDVLLLDSFSGEETLSQPFRFRLDLLSADHGITPDKIVGEPVLFSLRRGDGSRRPFSGYVRRFVGGPLHMRGLRRYHAEVVPWLWFLTRTTDCRIFQEKTVVQIAEDVFNGLGYRDFDTSQVQENHVKREYCVQYRESAFAFLSRLFEEEGIFYWFTQEDSGKHILHLADSKNAYQPCPQKEIELTEGSRSVDYLDSWRHNYEFRSGKWAQTDYNFEKPASNLKTAEETVVPISAFKSFEQFDWPGLYREKTDGDGLTRWRMEEEEWPYSVVEATTRSRGLLVGHKFSLTRHFDAHEKGDYVLTAVSHEASNASYIAGVGGTEDYAMTFECIPASTVFRPPRQTPKPRIHGLQTAVVVGRPGEEIDTDKYGRIKCQFFWDRYGNFDDKSSCWIRVAQVWASKSFGALQIPRIGDEVVIAFEEGDPDQPLVIGSVYNDKNMPPQELPKSKVFTGYKSNSSKGGGGTNYTFSDDTKDKEMLSTHAQYDMDTVVEHDQTWTVNNTFTETIKSHTKIMITEGTYDHDVMANTAKYHVKGALTENYDATQVTTVKQAITITSNKGLITVNAADNEVHVLAANLIKLQTGDSTLTMQSDGTITLTGKNITISGEKISTTGTNSVEMGVGTQTVTCTTSETSTAGAAIKHAAVGTQEITGAIVKIN